MGPTGVFTTRVFTGHDPEVKVVFSVPKQRHLGTMFASVGFIFEYLMLGVMSFTLLLSILPKKIIILIHESLGINPPIMSW